MDTNQTPTEPPVEQQEQTPSPPQVVPANPGTVMPPEQPGHKRRVTKKNLIISVLILLVLGGVAGGMFYNRQQQTNARLARELTDKKKAEEEAARKLAEEAQSKAEAEEAAKKAEQTVVTPKTTTPTKTTTQATQKLGCGPDGSSGSGTTTGYLGTNSYAETKKMLAAIEFAGLTSQVNGKQVVVLTPNDYVFENKLTSTQLAWMNQSAANMKSVIGWHIVTECITYAGLNPTKDKAAGATITLKTLNGTITYTQTGYGKFENAEIAIWDFFTENGAVTFVTGFVKPPQVP
jgi:cytoskeletal protein RodZ